MDYKNLFKKYWSKLIVEGIIKALFLGLIVGLSLSSVTAIIAIITDYNEVWLSICIGLGVTAIATPIFYFARFRLTASKLAARIDRLGLEERLITMMELEKDERYIALRQREDAKSKLDMVKRELIKLTVFSVPVIITLVSVFIFAATMITISAQSDTEDDPSIKPKVYVKVTYTVNDEDGFGLIEGDTEQTVLWGDNATTVVAIADDGYIFDKWSDGVTSAERTDKELTEDLNVSAKFLRLVEEEPPDGDGDEFEQGQGEEGDGEAPPDGSGPPGTGEGSRFEESNQIINGKEYYRDYYQYHYDMAMQIIAAGGNMPPYLKSIIEAYFDIIV